MTLPRKKLREILMVALITNAALVGVASAQAAPDIDIGTPAVSLLRSSMAGRFAQLQPHLQSGVLGLAHDGMIAIRNSAQVETATLYALQALIVEENKDRATLYREIARANRRPEWEADLRATFAKRWISRMPAGWYFRNEKGEWFRKE